jgi:putative transposase
VVFSKTVKVCEMGGDALAVDVNESNVTFGSQKRIVTKVETGERAIRTGYFLKRRRIQSAAGRFNRNKVLAKYRGRELRRIESIYHNTAN